MKNTLPTENENGSFNGRETRLGDCECGCGNPTAFFVDDDTVCDDQTIQIRQETDIDIFKQFKTMLGDSLAGMVIFNPSTGTGVFYSEYTEEE